jgi:inward rectifier potassium channel
MRPIRYRPLGADYEFKVIGHQRQPLRDFYHALLLWPWWVTLAALAGAFLCANAVFALCYLVTGGGITGAHPGSFRDAFFFSVQTMGTIGYGAMVPASNVANTIVVVESIAGLLFTALATGLVFAKFSRPNARMVFTRQAVVSPYDGVPTLTFRLGNERSNQIVDAQVRVTLGRTERTAEGHTFYRNYDLVLARDRMLSLSRSWTILHPIDARSPLSGATAESLRESEAELNIMVIGVDDTTMQLVHARHRYGAADVLFGRRHVDILQEESPDVMVVDLRRFHDTEPV